MSTRIEFVLRSPSFFFAGFWLLVLLTPCRVLAAVPTIGTIVSSDTGRGVGMYEKWELTFPVTTDAANLQMPYEPLAPPYAANLKPDEDARLGVSVDCLLLMPGQTDWAQAKVWPGFLYRNYLRTPPGAHKAQVENLVWAGADAWKVRFAPTVLGQWRYRVRVTDAGGAILSDPQSFVCVPSESRGFVRVSPTDRRYLQFDNGDSANLVGLNLFFNGWEDYQSRRAGISSTGAETLIRLWIAGRSGLEVIGGFANSSGGRNWNFGMGDTSCVLTTEDAHSGRFSVQMPSGGQLSTGEVPVRVGHAHTLSFWVKPVAVTGAQAQVTFSSKNADTYQDGASQSVPVASLTPDARGWTQLELPVPAFSGDGNLYAGIGIALENATGGHLLIDDVTETDAATGIDTLEVGDFERQVHYSQRQSWLLDAVVDDCAQNRQYLRLNCLENDDSAFCNVDADAISAPHSSDHFYGTSNDAAADLPVRRWQRYYARYLMARWGYSTAVAQFEYNNEGALFSGFHYAAAENFAQAIHTFAGEGRRLCGTSFWQNTSGTSYPADFYDSGTYPEIDYADVHLYTGPERDFGQFIPYAEADALRGSFVRIPDGGPGGMGCLRIDAATQAGGSILLLPAKIKGKGNWTVSYQGRTLGKTRINRGGHGLDLGIDSTALGGTPWLALPGLAMPAQPPAGDQAWKTYTDTFTVHDDALHPVALSLSVDGGGFTHGRIEVSDLKVVAPDGRLWAHETFSEPLLDKDAASFAQYLGLLYTSLSGDPMLDKPFSIGETDVQDNSPDRLFTTLQSDSTGAFLRQFVWAHLNPSGAIVFLWTGAGDLATTKGWWTYAAAYQKFLADVPLTNGHYRNAEAAVSDPRIIVIGQKDTQVGCAQIFVYNRDGNWFNLTKQPTAIIPVTGTVTIPGLPKGTYSLETWDTAQGIVKSRAMLASANGRLSIPIAALTGDTAFKIAPVPIPAPILSENAEKITAPLRK